MGVHHLWALEGTLSPLEVSARGECPLPLVCVSLAHSQWIHIPAASYPLYLQLCLHVLLAMEHMPAQTEDNTPRSSFQQ